jgi:hypothetical protein
MTIVILNQEADRYFIFSGTGGCIKKDSLQKLIFSPDFPLYPSGYFEASPPFAHLTTSINNMFPGYIVKIKRYRSDDFADDGGRGMHSYNGKIGEMSNILLLITIKTAIQKKDKLK